MKKALFWDFDGTLVLPDSKWSNALHSAFINQGYDISLEEVRNHLHSGYTWHTPQVAYTDSIGTKWWDKLFTHFGLLYAKHNLPERKADEINMFLKNRIIDYNSYSLYADTAFALQSCVDMGYDNYILSNNFPELPFVVEGLGLSNYFKDYVVSANIGYEKPRIEIFRHALKTAGSPAVCYMIGDNPIADIEGGKSVGMKTILVHNTGGSAADYACESLSQIPLLLTGKSYPDIPSSPPRSLSILDIGVAKEMNPDCPCTASCPRHGDCEACRTNHAGGLTKCQRIEKEREG